MRYNNYKNDGYLRSVLILSIFLFLTGYSLFSIIKTVILSESFLKGTNLVIDIIITKVRNLIIIETIILLLVASIILYKLSSDKFRGLYMDYLTGIHNKRFYDMKLKKYIKRVQINKKPLSVMMIDIDSFKKINDSYGHDKGDIVLKHLAEIIKINIRETDICCRFGGDEFVVILPDANEEEAKIVGERIIENLKYYPFKIEGHNKYKNITVSIGISKYYGNKSASKISKFADEALYISKSLGEGKITIYE